MNIKLQRHNICNIQNYDSSWKLKSDLDSREPGETKPTDQLWYDQPDFYPKEIQDPSLS